MFTPPPLPYAEDALEPYVSAKTLALNHGKHHKGYVETLNNLLTDDDALAALSLTDLIRDTFDDPARRLIFTNAVQSRNHDFFWKSMKPGGVGLPTGDLKVLIEHDIDDDKAFADAFAKTAA
jgi:Fe-Mn family superoxide dismutase